ncbi:hypothetical protein BLSTO_04830 [Blastocystis sp. subtype 1]
MDLLKQYSAALDTHPIVTKCITSLVLNSVSDILSQLITNNRKQRIQRNIRFMIWGAAFGVVAHYYLLLSNLLIPATSFGAVFLKLVVDQLLWTPFANTLFFFSISVMENPHKQPEEGIQSVKKNLWKTQKYNMMLWIPVQFVNFIFVPPQYQLLLINVVNLFWTCYLNITASSTSSYQSIQSDAASV